MRALFALGVAALALGCDLGIDESQIGTTGAGGSPPTSSPGSTGPGTSASQSSASTSSGDGGAPATTTTTATTTSTIASTSTGMPMLPEVICIDNMFNLVMCQPGQVCCIFTGGGFGHCADQCGAGESSLECDGPEDCDAGDDCCAPDEQNGDVTCVANCSDDDTVCKDKGDCSDTCSEEFSGPLGQAYVTCF